MFFLTLDSDGKQKQRKKGMWQMLVFGFFFCWFGYQVYKKYFVAVHGSRGIRLGQSGARREGSCIYGASDSVWLGELDARWSVVAVG